MDEQNDLNRKIRLLEELDEIEKMVKDNKIEFDHCGEMYRVRRMNVLDKSLMRAHQNKRLNELMSDPNYKTAEQVVKEWKSKGIDIEEIEKNIRLYVQELKALGIKTIEADGSFQGNFLEKLAEIKNEITRLSTEKSEYLQYSIESEMGTAFSEYLTFLVLERKTDDDKFVRHFETFEDYAKCPDEALRDKAISYASHLTMRDYDTRNDKE